MRDLDLWCGMFEAAHGRRPTAREQRVGCRPWHAPATGKHGRRETARERKARMRLWWRGFR